MALCICMVIAIPQCGIVLIILLFSLFYCRSIIYLTLLSCAHRCVSRFVSFWAYIVSRSHYRHTHNEPRPLTTSHTHKHHYFNNNINFCVKNCMSLMYGRTIGGQSSQRPAQSTRFYFFLLFSDLWTSN